MPSAVHARIDRSGWLRRPPFGALDRLSEEETDALARRQGEELACDSGPDRDGDGIADARDNCVEVANRLQEDADFGRDDDASLRGVQHYGDACDVDLDNDGVVGASDFFGHLRPAIGKPPGPGFTRPLGP